MTDINQKLIAQQQAINAALFNALQKINQATSEAMEAIQAAVAEPVEVVVPKPAGQSFYAPHAITFLIDDAAYAAVRYTILNKTRYMNFDAVHRPGWRHYYVARSEMFRDPIHSRLASPGGSRMVFCVLPPSQYKGGDWDDSLALDLKAIGWLPEEIFMGTVDQAVEHLERLVHNLTGHASDESVSAEDDSEEIAVVNPVTDNRPLLTVYDPTATSRASQKVVESVYLEVTSHCMLEFTYFPPPPEGLVPQGTRRQIYTYSPVNTIPTPFAAHADTQEDLKIAILKEADNYMPPDILDADERGDNIHHIDVIVVSKDNLASLRRHVINTPLRGEAAVQVKIHAFNTMPNITCYKGIQPNHKQYVYILNDGIVDDILEEETAIINRLTSDHIGFHLSAIGFGTLEQFKDLLDTKLYPSKYDTPEVPG